MTIACYIDIDKVPTITTMLQHRKTSVESRD